MKKIAIIGMGSIGKRHFKMFTDLSCEVRSVSSYIDNSYKTIKECIADFNPEYVVISTDTSRHFDSLTELISSNFKGNVLIEKPIFDKIKVIPDNK